MKTSVATAMPYSGFHGDEDWPEMTPAEEAERDAEVDRKVKELLCSEAWWDLTMCGDNEIFSALPACLARVMANLDNACSGDQIGRDAVTTALSQLQRVARDMAQKEVEQDN